MERMEPLWNSRVQYFITAINFVSILSRSDNNSNNVTGSLPKDGLRTRSWTTVRRLFSDVTKALFCSGLRKFYPNPFMTHLKAQDYLKNG